MTSRMQRLVRAVERTNSQMSENSGKESYSSFVQRKYSRKSDDEFFDDDCSDIDDACSACSSLTSSSGDTFHVFTDASVSVDGVPEKREEKQAKEVLLGEKKRLQSERHLLELERQKLQDERKKLEEERRRLRMSNDDAFRQMQAEKEAEAMDKKIQQLSKEREQLELEGEMKEQMQDIEQQELELDKEGLDKLTDLEKSEETLAENFKNIRRLTKESRELKKINDDLDKTSLHLVDLENHTKRANRERLKKQEQIKRQEEEQRKKILEKARIKLQEERRLRQEAIRSRIASEEAEAKRKKKEKEESERKKAEQVKTKDESVASRAQRAYGWYSKLALPTRVNMKKKIKLIASIDITEEDVDLLPWNGMGTMVNVAKLNSMYVVNKSR